MLLDAGQVTLVDVAGDRLLDQPLLVGELAVDLEEVLRNLAQLSGRIDGGLLGRGLWAARSAVPERIPRPGPTPREAQSPVTVTRTTLEMPVAKGIPGAASILALNLIRVGRLT